jgi:hypothetical protein
MTNAWTLTVTTAAADLQLLSQSELRVAAGLPESDTSQDARLATLGLQASAAIAGACGIAKAGYDASLMPLRGEAPLTFKAETLSQSFRIWPGNQVYKLMLARWPLLSINSVTTNATALTVDQWDVDIPQAALLYISNSSPIQWPCSRVIVQYDAGYDVIPDDLKGYAARLVGLYYTSEGDDPFEKRVEVPGVITIDRWVDTSADNLMPNDIMNGLARDGYRRVLA